MMCERCGDNEIAATVESENSTIQVCFTCAMVALDLIRTPAAVGKLAVTWKYAD